MLALTDLPLSKRVFTLLLLFKTLISQLHRSTPKAVTQSLKAGRTFLVEVRPLLTLAWILRLKFRFASLDGVVALDQSV